MALCAYRCVWLTTKDGHIAGEYRELTESEIARKIKICAYCRDGIRRDSFKTGTELEIKQKRHAAKGRQYEEIRGHNGEGPVPGSYCAQLFVKRRARERDKKKRLARAPAKHFPRHAAH